MLRVSTLANAAVWLAYIWYGAVYFVRLLGVVLHVYRVRICTHNAPKAAFSGGASVSELPGVTILRPLLGADSSLRECLRSSFRQSYPNFEVLMCVASDTDPAVSVANELIAEYPQVRARLLVGREDGVGINPKVCNLAKGYRAAKFDLVWALDSNVCMDAGALGRAVPLFLNNANVQLVHHLPIAYASSETKFGGLLDEVYMLTAHSTFYTGINAVGVAPCVTGKSNLYRRSDVDRSVGSPGGLEHFAKYMAEDQMISEALWKQGGRTAVAPDGAVQPLGSKITFTEFWNRRSRWVRLRKYMVTSATLVEPFTDCFFGTLFFKIVANLRWSTFMGLCFVWFLVDLFNYKVLIKYTPSPGRPLWLWTLVWLVRELVAFPLWLYSMLGRRFLWRGHYYVINPNLEAVHA